MTLVILILTEYPVLDFILLKNIPRKIFVFKITLDNKWYIGSNIDNLKTLIKQYSKILKINKTNNIFFVFFIKKIFKLDKMLYMT